MNVAPAKGEGFLYKHNDNNVFMSILSNEGICQVSQNSKTTKQSCGSGNILNTYKRVSSMHVPRAALTLERKLF